MAAPAVVIVRRRRVLATGRPRARRITRSRRATRAIVHRRPSAAIIRIRRETKAIVRPRRPAARARPHPSTRALAQPRVARIRRRRRMAAIRLRSMGNRPRGRTRRAITSMAAVERPA
jgi:hypothetical protein